LYSKLIVSAANVEITLLAERRVETNKKYNIQYAKEY
jgi:hypothetical protein